MVEYCQMIFEKLEVRMKRIFNIIIVALALMALCGCDGFGQKESTPVTGPKMVAEIVAIGEKLEVEVIEGEYGASGIYWVNVGDDTIYETEGGEKISADSLKIGDRIEIIYNGQVMMSYPPQIVARKIVILD